MAVTNMESWLRALLEEILAGFLLGVRLRVVQQVN